MPTTNQCKCMSKEWGNNCVCNQLPYTPGTCILGDASVDTKMNDSESKALWKIVSELKGQGKAHQYFLELYQTRFEKLEERLLELEQWTRKDEDRVYDRINKMEQRYTEVLDVLFRHKQNTLKWQRDVEEKCIRTIDKNKELQVEVDALKQMIWKLREKIHDDATVKPSTRT